jgi:tetratricopeptide (TPR) repeat protein
MGRKEAAQADFARAAEAKGGDPMPWIEHGRLLAETGDHAGADAAFSRAASLTPNELNRFLEGGWWVVGQYPPDFQQPCPPEKEADPSKPVTSVNPGQEEKWRHVPTGEFGTVNLEGLFSGPNRSAYALTYVYSPEDRPVLLRISSKDGGRCDVRSWLNGRLVHETNQGTLPAHQDRVPVQLSRGRNTLLVRVNKFNNDHAFVLRIAANPMDQAFEKAALGLWPEAAAELTQLQERGQLNHWWQRHYFAICLAAAGDWAAYRKFAASMVEEFRRHPADPYDLAQIAGLSAGVIEDKDALLRLGEDLSSRQNPDGWWWRIPAGIMFYRAGKFEQALTQFETIKDSEGDPRSLVGKALAHHGLGNADEARRWLAAARDIYDQHTRVALDARPVWFGWPGTRWNHFAHFQVMYQEARALIEGKDLPSEPNREAMLKRARQEWKNRDPATAPYDLALGINPWAPHLWLARARRYAELKRDQEADAAFARAVAQKPDDPQVWKECGRTHAELGQLDRAAADFVKALELVKEGKDWAEDRGGIDSTLAPWKEVFERVAELRPRDRAFWFHRLRYLGNRHQWREASALAEKFLELVPDSPMLRYSYAPLFLELGDQQAYRRVCQEMLKMWGNGETPGASQQTAMTCLLTPETMAPKEDLLKLAQTAMQSGRPAWLRGWSELTLALAQVRTGDAATAVKTLKEVPRGSLVHQATVATVLALACHEQNQPAQARQALESVRVILTQRQQQFDGGLLYAGNEWQDWLRCRVLFREASSKMTR